MSTLKDLVYKVMIQIKKVHYNTSNVYFPFYFVCSEIWVKTDTFPEGLLCLGQPVFDQLTFIATREPERESLTIAPSFVAIFLGVWIVLIYDQGSVRVYR